MPVVLLVPLLTKFGQQTTQTSDKPATKRIIRRTFTFILLINTRHVAQLRPKWAPSSASVEF